MGLIKIFSGSEILARALKLKIEALDINVVMKDNIQSGKFAGFGISDLAVELFIQETDYNKAYQTIEDYRMSLS